jgi:hypothetical protein
MNEPPTDETLLATITGQIGQLHRRALDAYSPVVEQIIASGSRDARHIEETLDGLLDFAGHHSVLPLYRRLCRHYFAIDPAAAAHYVRAYREMYDAEGDTVTEGKE